MNCRFVETRLAAYIDGELDGAEMLRVRSHVSDCKECAAELQEMRIIKTAVGSLPARRPVDGFESRLLSSIVTEDAKTVRIGSGVSFRFGLGGMAVAAAAAVCAVIVFGLNQPADESVAGATQAAVPREGFERDQMYFQANSPLSQGVTVSYEGLSGKR